MASSKRQRTSTRPSTSKKKPKYSESSPPEHEHEVIEAANQSDEDKWWTINGVLDEWIQYGERVYLVEWQDIDPSTGRVYESSETTVVTDDVLEAWEEQKARTGYVVKTRSVRPAKAKARAKKSRQRKQPAKRSRKSRVVESRPEPPAAVSSSAPPSEPSAVTRDSATIVLLSSRTSSPAHSLSISARQSPLITIQPQGSSLERREWERFSQLPPSQVTNTQYSERNSLDLGCSQLFAAGLRSSPGIEPDTQSTVGEASFEPPTQHTEGSSHSNTPTQGSQEYITEDSGLLEIVEGVAERAGSPAVSIPETIADTGVDSQSQAQRATCDKLREIPDTVEILQSSSQSAEIPAGQQQSPRQGSELIEPSICDHDQDVLKTQEDCIQLSSAEWTSRPTQAGATTDTVPSQDTLEVHIESQDIGLDHSSDTTSQTAIATEVVIGATAEASNPADRDEFHHDCQIRVPVVADQDERLRDTSQGEATPGASAYAEASLIDHSATEEEGLLLDTRSRNHESASQQGPAIPKDCAGPLAERDSEGGSVDLDAAIATSVAVSDQHGPASSLSTNPNTSAAPSPRATTTIQEWSTQHPDIDLPSLTASANTNTENNWLQTVSQTQQDTATSNVAPAQIVHISEHSNNSVHYRDFAFAERQQSPPESSASPQQYAQTIAAVALLYTQEEHPQSLLPAESIRPTIEKEDTQFRASSESRHDSSQESPERTPDLSWQNSSPIPQPPSNSIGTFDSRLPDRPASPIATSSVSTMSGAEVASDVERRLKELIEQRVVVNPFTPIGRRKRQTQDSPAGTATDGTRSPSIVPDRLPASQIPTSLRTVASTDNDISSRANEILVDDVPTITDQNLPTGVGLAISEPELAMAIDNPTVAEFAESQSSDADDEESDSPLDDQLHLEPEEYIVPLALNVRGRQHDTYLQYIDHKKDILDKFLQDHESYSPLSDVEDVVQYMRDIETHIDLIFEEAGDENSATQIEYMANFGEENSIKFKFLSILFGNLQEQSKHVVLVIEQDRDDLFRIIENFCKAKSIDYNIPSKSHAAPLGTAEGNLIVTVLSRDASPIIRRPDLIICLDGVQEAKKIRQKNWAQSSDDGLVPVCHLVVPRTVGHIDRYLPGDANRRRNLHTTLACLAQMKRYLGQAIDEETPDVIGIADAVTIWLLHASDEPAEWPLVSIGSLRDEIEFQSQLPRPSTVSPAPERHKRPLEIDDVDTAKRMRLTPQPPQTHESEVQNEFEVTHVSDSMPGTALNERSLQTKVIATERALAEARADVQSFSELEEQWDKRQTRYEDQERAHRLLLGEQQRLQEQLSAANNNKEVISQRLAERTTQLRDVSDQLEAQRKLGSLSEDEKDREITRLRIELAAAQEETKRAVSNMKTAENMFEHLKEMRHKADETVRHQATTIEELQKENAKLEQQASGEATKLKALHLDNQYKLQARQMDRMKIESTNLKRTLAQREEELARAKSNVGRIGYGTRGQSVTPQPKVRSRAGSPMGGRVSNLRMNN